MRLKDWIFVILAGVIFFAFFSWRMSYQDKVIRNRITGTVIARTVDGEVIIQHPDGSMSKERTWHM